MMFLAGNNTSCKYILFLSYVDYIRLEYEDNVRDY